MWPERSFPSGDTTGLGSRSERVVVGEVAVVEQERTEASESVLDCRERRRKGMEGRRKVEKRVGVGCGSEGLRRKDIAIDSGGWRT